MDENTAVAPQTSSGLRPYLSPLGAWALSVGTSIGWGSFVVTSSSYLLQAGPLGSLLGLLAGMVMMLAIGYNYHYLISEHADAGGAYSYVCGAFGHDYGYALAWFLGLTYASMLWANATSLPLFVRYVVGGVLHQGLHYQLFGYDVHGRRRCGAHDVARSHTAGAQLPLGARHL